MRRYQNWSESWSFRKTRAIAYLATCSSIAVVACSSLRATASPTIPTPVAVAQQLIVVTTPGWDSTVGLLRRFERSSVSSVWRSVGSSVPVVLGRTGLAWGVGFDDADAAPRGTAPHKREGDGRSPAGAFPLDTVFGFAPRDSMSWVRAPYVPLTPASDCVDDVESVHYNTVVARTAVSRVDWSSAEHMREITQYRLGVIVGYNASPPVRGRGSCIFLHIWAGPRSTTAGCTALDAGELRRLTEWLDARRNPALVQLPAVEYQRLRERWALPALN